MNKIEIAANLRQEVGELEVAIKKLQARCERLKTFVLDLEAEIESANGAVQKKPADSKFQKVIDQVFGEKPRRIKR
jgi:phage shock protein A